MTNHLKANFYQDEILSFLLQIFQWTGEYDSMMRRVQWKPLAQKVGSGLKIGIGYSFKHQETFSFENNVNTGNCFLHQDRFDGNAKIEDDGSRIGQQAFLDATELLIGKDVRLGLRIKKLESVHTGIPTHLPIFKTYHQIKTVIIEEVGDIGAGMSGHYSSGNKKR